MPKLNAKNERLKHDFLIYLKGARGKSEASLDAVRKALLRFEDYTGAKDFKTFRREQAIGFRDRLAETQGARTGVPLSHATQASTLAALREFFGWLTSRPGFKSRIDITDCDYFSLSMKDNAKAKAAKLRDFPSLEQIRATIAAMPVETVIDRRNRALMAFAILTGMRDRAIVSLSLRHLDMSKSPPLVRQEPDRVATKFSKSINTYFFPIGDNLKTIVSDWIDELRELHLFGPNDPIFPKTWLRNGTDKTFEVAGIERTHWRDASPVRAIFKQAFEAACLPYFPPHSFRHTLGHLMDTACKTFEQTKAWSQNLGHEHLGTTVMSYGRIDPHRQGDVIAGISLTDQEPDGALVAEIAALMSRHRERV